MKATDNIIKIFLLTLLSNATLISCSNFNNPAKFTVSINGIKNGTGFVIKREENTHFVLTSRHVIRIKPSENIEILNPLPDEENFSGKEVPYTVTTSDNKTYEINYDTVKQDPNLDLAIFSFSSQKKYGVAQLSTAEIQPENIVDIYGFKACNNSNLTNEDKLEHNRGVIVKIDPEMGRKDEGYSIFYTNPTVTGMSGSPVLNEKGKVIAIHGKPGQEKTAKDAILRDCSPLDESFTYNWGIPMKSFINSSLAQELGLKLK